MTTKFAANDVGEHEQITFSCPKCLKSATENAREFFEKVPSLRGIELTCTKCNVLLTVECS